MSSSNPTFSIEETLSSINNTSVLSENISSNSSRDGIIPQVFPTFYNDVQAYYAQNPIPSPALQENNSPESSDDFTKYLLDTLVFSPLHDNPNDVNELPTPPSQTITALPAIIPPSMFDFRDFFSPEEVSSLEGTETHVESLIPISPPSSVESSSPVKSAISPPNYPFDKSIFAELDNSLWIIPRLLGEKPDPEEHNESDNYDYPWK